MQANDPPSSEPAAQDHAADVPLAISTAPEPSSGPPDAPDAPATPATTPSTPDMTDGPSLAQTSNEESPPQQTKTVADLSPAQCAAKLAELFPALFAAAVPTAPGAAAEPPKPLKLRIQADIQQRAPGIFSKRSLSIFLSRYTTGNAYIRALVAAPHRFDLDGQPAGEISEEHLAAAKEEMARRRAIHEERRAAEREAQRQARAAAQRQAQADAPPRPAREPRAARNDAPRHEAGNRPSDGAAAPHGPRGARPSRPPPSSNRSERPRGPRSPQGAAPRQMDTAQGPHSPRPAQPPAAAALPEDPARRERAQLLRLFEASSLTKANFCVLKRISETELDAQLALALQERGPAPRR